MKTIEIKGKKVVINDKNFILNTDPNAALDDFGWTPEYVQSLVFIAENEPDHELMHDADVLNDLGLIFNDAVCVERDMTKAIKYYELAINLNNDLARSNLADIYRKGSHGVPINHNKAFQLYKACHLPYAFYRVGEYYENGKAGIQDIEQAKFNYRIAYNEGHGLARKKLQTLNFLD